MFSTVQTKHQEVEMCLWMDRMPVAVLQMLGPAMLTIIYDV